MEHLWQPVKAHLTPVTGQTRLADQLQRSTSIADLIGEHWNIHFGTEVYD